MCCRSADTSSRAKSQLRVEPKTLEHALLPVTVGFGHDRCQQFGPCVRDSLSFFFCFSALPVNVCASGWVFPCWRSVPCSAPWLWSLTGCLRLCRRWSDSMEPSSPPTARTSGSLVYVSRTHRNTQTQSRRVHLILNVIHQPVGCFRSRVLFAKMKPQWLFYPWVVSNVFVYFLSHHLFSVTHGKCKLWCAMDCIGIDYATTLTKHRGSYWN